MARVALAYVAAQGIIAIPGTTEPEHLVENRSSRDTELTDEEMKATPASISALKPQGNRYDEVAMGNIGT